MNLLSKIVNEYQHPLVAGALTTCTALAVAQLGHHLVTAFQSFQNTSIVSAGTLTAGCFVISHLADMGVQHVIKKHLETANKIQLCLISSLSGMTAGISSGLLMVSFSLFSIPPSSAHILIAWEAIAYLTYKIFSYQIKIVREQNDLLDSLRVEDATQKIESQMQEIHKQSELIKSQEEQIKGLQVEKIELNKAKEKNKETTEGLQKVVHEKDANIKSLKAESNEINDIKQALEDENRRLKARILDLTIQPVSSTTSSETPSTDIKVNPSQNAEIAPPLKNSDLLSSIRSSDKKKLRYQTPPTLRRKEQNQKRIAVDGQSSIYDQVGSQVKKIRQRQNWSTEYDPSEINDSFEQQQKELEEGEEK